MESACVRNFAFALASLLCIPAIPSLAGDPPAGPAGAKAGPAAPEPMKVEVEAIEACLRRREWSFAASRANAVLARDPQTSWRLMLLLLSAEGHCYAREYVGCLVRTEEILSYPVRFGIDVVPWTEQALELRAEALLGLGREEEARRTLLALRERNPAPGDLSRARLIETVLKSAGLITHDFSYDGKFRDDPRLGEAMRASPESLVKAMERVRWWLAAPDLEFPPLVLRFGDDDWSAEGAAAWAESIPRGGGTVGVVTIGVESLLRGAWKDRGLLAHELGHVLRQAGSPGSSAAPWFEEGIAHWISADLDEEMPGYVLAWRICPAHFVAGGAPEAAPLPAVPPTEAGVAALTLTEQRLCGVLFFHHVERRFGLKATRALVLELLRSPAPSAKVAERLGRTTDELFATIATEFRPDAHETKDLGEIRRLLHDGAWTEAEARCRAFCDTRPPFHWEGRLVPVARRGQVAALFGQGRDAEARRVLRDAIEEHRGSSAHPWLLLEELRLARRDGDSHRVVALGAEIRSERSRLDDAARKEVQDAVREAQASLAKGEGK